MYLFLYFININKLPLYHELKSILCKFLPVCMKFIFYQFITATIIYRIYRSRGGTNYKPNGITPLD